VENRFEVYSKDPCCFRDNDELVVFRVCHAPERDHDWDCAEIHDLVAEIVKAMNFQPKALAALRAVTDITRTELTEMEDAERMAMDVLEEFG